MEVAQEQMDSLGGWEFREQAEAMLQQVGLPSSTQLVGSLSGGQKRRVALAAALLANPDLIVADEPTNHMDHQVMSCRLCPDIFLVLAPQSGRASNWSHANVLLRGL